MTRKVLLLATLAGVHLLSPEPVLAKSRAETGSAAAAIRIHHRTARIDGIDIFYREAGSPNAPTIVLLHGFPTSSHMYRNLIPLLADRYHVIAPDFPGFGQSSSPDRSEYAYTFDNLATSIGALLREKKVGRYALYVMDYGAPVGFRLASGNPDQVTALIVQNGNAYAEGIEDFWNPIKAYWKTGGATEREALRWLTSARATHFQYTDGVQDLSLVSPDTWTIDQTLLDRPGNQEIQLDLFYDYRRNVDLYPKWQAYFRERKPPTLVLWGKNDKIFVPAGAQPYRRDNPAAEIHFLDTGHFALETHGAEIAAYIRDFLGRTLPSSSGR